MYFLMYNLHLNNYLMELNNGKAMQRGVIVHASFFIAQKRKEKIKMLKISILFGIFSIISDSLLRVEKYFQKENKIIKKYVKMYLL